MRPQGQRVFHAGSRFRAFTARFNPVHALRQDARGLGADADHRKGRVRAHGGACGGEEFRIGMFPAGGHEPYATRLLAAARAGHRILEGFAEDGALAFLPHSHSASWPFCRLAATSDRAASSISVTSATMAHALRGFRTSTGAFHNKGRAVGKIGQAAKEEAALADDAWPV